MQVQLRAKRVKPEQALAVLIETPADTLFRWGFRDTEGSG